MLLRAATVLHGGDRFGPQHTVHKHLPRLMGLIPLKGIVLGNMLVHFNFKKVLMPLSHFCMANMLPS